MSDIAIQIPLIYLIPLVGVAFWPVTLSFGLLTLALAFAMRRLARYVLMTVSVILLADSAMALFWTPN